MPSEMKMIRRGFPPSLFIIGAQKSGTTFLADMLSQHPMIRLAKQKETGFFTRQYDKGLEWYQRCFPDSNDLILLDASTAYTMAPVGTHARNYSKNSDFLRNVPTKINNLINDAHFIYIIRNPVLRAYSAYWHNVRAGHEKNSLNDALKKNSVYLRTSNYMGQLQEYLKIFPENRIKIIIFEEAIKNPLEVYRECCRFIGIEDNYPPIIEKKNSSFVYVGILQKLNQMLSPIGGINPMLNKISKIIPKKIVEMLGKLISRNVPKITNDQYEHIDNKIKESTKDLEKYLGRSIDIWHR